MTKQEMINQLEDRVSYNMALRAYYEDLFEKDGNQVWQEEIHWYKGKIVGLMTAIEMADELS